MGGGYAWVTLATNDSYSLGSLVLAHSLKQVGTKQQLAVLVTPGVTNSMRSKLNEVFNVVKEVNILDSKDEANLRLLKRPELGITFTKLHCWRLTQFEKCVFLDADTLILENCDELFEREELSAAPDIGWPDCFNSGVFVYRPSNETYEKLIQFALEKGSFDGGDQGLLNLYFSDWAHKDISKHLPFIYNLASTACYSYLPAFKQFGKNAKIIHFIGASKPWLQYFNTETRKVQPSEGLQHLETILQHWWNIFCNLIYPALTPDMGGLAGAFANLTLGKPRTPEQQALDDHLRRQGWEVGNIDYLGRDAFENIWSKICETLAQGPEAEVEPAASEEKPTEPAAETVASPETATSVEAAQTPELESVKVEPPTAAALSDSTQLESSVETVTPPSETPQPTLPQPTETPLQTLPAESEKQKPVEVAPVVTAAPETAVSQTENLESKQVIQEPTPAASAEAQDASKPASEIKESTADAAVSGTETAQPVPTQSPAETQLSTQPVTQPSVEPSTQQPVEASTKPPVESPTKPLVEPPTESLGEPTTQAPAEPSAQPLVEPSTQPLVESSTQPSTEPIKEPEIPKPASTTQPEIQTAVSKVPEKGAEVLPTVDSKPPIAGSNEALPAQLEPQKPVESPVIVPKPAEPTPAQSESTKPVTQTTESSIPTKESSKESIKESQKETPKESPKEAPKEALKEAPKTAPKEAQKDTPKESKETQKETPKESPKEAQKETPKEPSKDTQKETPKESPKEAQKEPPKETQKETTKQLPKEVQKEASKEPSKEGSKKQSKEATKDAPKEVPQESEKPVPKQTSKQSPKDTTKKGKKDEGKQKETAQVPSSKVTEPTPPTTPASPDSSIPSPLSKSELQVSASVPETPPPAAPSEAASGPTPPPRKSGGGKKK